MPFTPFHMGPGTAIKAVFGKYFSLTVFGFAQVMMDIEPLVRMVRGDMILHGATHTYLGAICIGGFSALVGKPICVFLLRFWNAGLGSKTLRWLRIRTDIAWIPAITGAFIGTFSHVFLDSMMHADMQPFAPFSSNNGLLGFLPLGFLHVLCVFFGVFGVFTIFLVWAWRKWSIDV
ncbi:DUF4184 family protein [Methylomonas sp. YC3]